MFLVADCWPRCSGVNKRANALMQHTIGPKRWCHVRLERPFRRVSIDLIDFEPTLITAVGVACRYVLLAMNQLTRYIVSYPVPSKVAEGIASGFTDRLIRVSDPPEILHSDRGLEFEDKIFTSFEACQWREIPDLIMLSTR